MTFGDLKNCKFLLKVSAEGCEDLSFELDVVGVKGNTVIANPVVVDGKEVSFESKNISTELWAIEVEKPPYTAKARCGFSKNGDSVLLVISALSNPIKMNKRAAYRVGLYLPCDVQLGLSKAVKGEIINGSDNGFAVKMLTEDEIKPLKDVLSVSFTDDEAFNSTLNLTGICVRKEDRDSGNIYGCRILESTGGFKSYLVKKQSRRCRN